MHTTLFIKQSFEYNYADLSFTQTARIKMQQRIADGTMYATINGVTLNRPIGVPIPDTILILQFALITAMSVCTRLL